MKHVVSRLVIVGFALGAAGLAGLAFAQEGGPSADISTWFVDTASLAAVVALATAFVRKHLWDSLDGFAVVLFSIGMGAVLGVAGSLLGYLEGGVFGGLLFGAGAGLAASGGVDGLRSLMGGAKTSDNSTTHTDAARSLSRR